MFDDMYALEELMRNRRKELEEKLRRAANHHHYPLMERKSSGIWKRLGALLVSVGSTLFKS